ncbi:hypothetical protein FSP39_003621 [Pinctada imbricata]|uniref:H15 domain-containing protein n=1 Tax=Pinctada imbricata TaxID=66713 RepID=A0AA89BLF6_PINIB|nr:hypothetical protein FSP39_003621 [Pinctada imbricata]
MADTAAAPAPPKAKTPKKKAAAKKSQDHPKYSAMVKAAVTAIKDRKGASTPAIRIYINKNFKVDPTKVNSQLKKALKKAVDSGALKQVSGTGAAGRFRLAEKKVEKKAKKTAAKKPKAKTAKPKAAKPAAKKVKKPKAAKKSPKKAKAAKPKAAKPKSPKKAKAAKPKKAKTPKKKAGAKKAAK